MSKELKYVVAGVNDEDLQKLMDQLGVPASAKAWTLKCRVGEIVTIEVEYYPEVDGELGFTKKYDLVEKEY